MSSCYLRVTERNQDAEDYIRTKKSPRLGGVDTLFNKRDYAAAERFWSPDYIQHLGFFIARSSTARKCEPQCPLLPLRKQTRAPRCRRGERLRDPSGPRADCS